MKASTCSRCRSGAVRGIPADDRKRSRPRTDEGTCRGWPGSSAEPSGGGATTSGGRSARTKPYHQVRLRLGLALVRPSPGCPDEDPDRGDRSGVGQVAVAVRRSYVWFLSTNTSGCSEAWLSHVLWEHETVGSNPTTPTTASTTSRRHSRLHQAGKPAGGDRITTRTATCQRTWRGLRPGAAPGRPTSVLEAPCSPSPA